MEKIGKYEVVRQIGTGGFGAVYEGRDPYIKRRVAIKTCGAEDAEMRERFVREAEIAGNLEHRNVTAVYDFGYTDAGVPYLVQEYLDGLDLDKRLAQGPPLPTARKLDVLLQVARGLEYAHRHGVVHRDVKPANIRILDDGRVKIMDFGVALLVHVESRLTKTGITLGTAAYLPPEQIRGEKVDARADIFSYGVLAYELLSGRRPFGGRRLSEVMAEILHGTPTPLGEVWRDCPAGLPEVVHRCLEKQPVARYPEIGAVIRALEPILASCEALAEMSEPPSVATVPTRVMAPDEVARLEQEAGRRRERQVATLLERARARMEPGGWELASLALQEVLALEPGHEEATRLLAGAKTAQAAEAAERARAGERARAAVRVAALLDRGALVEGEAALREAERDAGDPAAFAELRRRLAELQQSERQARVVELLNRSRAATEAGDLTLAVRQLEDAREADTGNQDVGRLLQEAHEALRQRAAQRRLEETQPGILIAEDELDATQNAEARPALLPPELEPAPPSPAPSAPAATAPAPSAPADRVGTDVLVVPTLEEQLAPAARPVRLMPPPAAAGSRRGLILGLLAVVVLMALAGTVAWLLLGARRAAPPPVAVASPVPEPPPPPPPTTARLTLPASALAGATVAINGGSPQPLSQSLVLQLPPGEHRLVFAAPGHKSSELPMVVAAGEERALVAPTLVAEPRPRRRPTVAPPPPPQPVAPEPVPIEEPPPPPPPPAVQRGELVDPGPGVVPPRSIQIPAAHYPALAQRQRREATVVVSVLVDENGRVVEARVDQGGPPGFGFDEAALEAARRATFHPATKDGVEVKMWKQIRLGFRVR